MFIDPRIVTALLTPCARSMFLGPINGAGSENYDPPLTVIDVGRWILGVCDCTIEFRRMSFGEPHRHWLATA